MSSMERAVMAVGIDMGGTKLRAAGVDQRGRIPHLLGAPSPPAAPPPPQRPPIEGIRAVTAMAGCRLEELQGVGIGIPGWMDRVSGTMIFAPKLAHWQGVFALDAIRAELGLPIFVDSDPNAATLGELWMGAGRGSRN